MNKWFLIIIFYSVFYQSQKINIKDFGAKGNGITNDAPAFNKAIDAIFAKGKYQTIYIPEGVYLLDSPILLKKWVNILGEDEHNTVLKVKNFTNSAITIVENEGIKEDYQTYTSIKNLTIEGPYFGVNFYGWFDVKKNNTNSVGIKILGYRNRIENCNIIGFTGAGIECNATYYNFISKSFLAGNKIGLLINKTCTSTYVNECEIRNNSIGIMITDQSYSSFINNNMIESNIAHYLDPEATENENTPMSTGFGILLLNASHNFINNNYFENHFYNISLNNSSNNTINSNFFAIGTLMPENYNNQNILKMVGDSKNNTIVENKTMKSAAQLSDTKMVIDPKSDFGTNTIDFGTSKNAEIKQNFQKLSKPQNAPKVD